jgi:hypothetical protein
MSTIQQDIPVIVGLTINMNIVVFLISIIKLLIFAISSPYIIENGFFVYIYSNLHYLAYTKF